jgi:hypothetical protein
LSWVGYRGYHEILSLFLPSLSDTNETKTSVYYPNASFDFNTEPCWPRDLETPLLSTIRGCIASSEWKAGDDDLSDDIHELGYLSKDKQRYCNADEAEQKLKLLLKSRSDDDYVKTLTALAKLAELKGKSIDWHADGKVMKLKDIFRNCCTKVLSVFLSLSLFLSISLSLSLSLCSSLVYSTVKLR